MTADRVYRLLLLLAYPAELRAEYGRDMLVAFRDARRDRKVSERQFWLDIVRDIARASIPNAAANAAAAIAVVSGALLGGSAVVETVAGAGDQDGVSLVVLALVAIAGVLLLRCGIAMWRRTDDTSTIVRRAAIACFVIVGVVAAYRPMISVFARLLGLAIPLMLLAMTLMYIDSRYITCRYTTTRRRR